MINPTAAAPRFFPDRIADCYRNYPDHHHDRAAQVQSRPEICQGNLGARCHPNHPHHAGAVLFAVWQYAASLTELGPPASGAEGPAAANLIDSTLASGEKGGYKFTLSANSGGYVINAAPVSLRRQRQPDILLGPIHGGPPEFRPGTGDGKQSGNEIRRTL